MAGYNQGAGQTPNSGHNQTGSPPAGGYDAAAAAAMMKGAHGGAAGNAQANAGAANPAAMMKAHGAGGAQPGAAGAAGGYAAGAGANPAGFGPGIAGAGSGGGGAQQFPAGSAEAALAKFCMAIADGNLTEAAEYVSPKAKGMLVQIRDGSLTDEKLDSLKSSLAPQDLQLRPNARSSGTGKAINLGNGKNELLSFTLVKEDDAYLLREFRITKAPTR